MNPLVKQPDTSSSSTTEPKPRSKAEQILATVTLDRLIAEVELVLREGQRAVDEWEVWPTTVAAQVRVSKSDYAGRTPDSPERQMRRIAEYCVEYELCPVYMCAEVKSAYSERRPRKRFEEFFRLIESGELQVDHVLCYHGDRFTRRLNKTKPSGSEWLRLLTGKGIGLQEACSEHGPQPWTTDREDHFTKRFHEAQQSSDRTSARIRDQFDWKARSGEILGKLDAFCHSPIYEDRAGQQIQTGAKVVESEALWLREAYDRVEAGEALNTILRDLTSRGFRGRSGAEIRYNRFKILLTAPRMAGLVRRVNDDGNTYRLEQSNIEPVIDREKWERCVEILNTDKGMAEKQFYLLSGLGKCSCGAHLIGSSRGKNGNRARAPYYHCAGSGRPGPHSAIEVPAADSYVMQVALLALDPEHLSKAMEELPQEDMKAREKELTGRRESLTEKRRRVSMVFLDGAIDDAERERRLEEINAEQEQISAELASIVGTRRRAETVITQDQLLKKWDESDNSWRRAQLDKIIKSFTLAPAPAKRRWRSEERIEIEFHNGFNLGGETLQELADNCYEERYARKVNEGWDYVQAEPEDEAFIWSLYHEQGKRAGEIVTALKEAGKTSPSGNESWSVSTVRAAIKRCCLKHGVEFRRDNGGPKGPETPAATRELIFSLRHKKGLPYKEIVIELEKACTKAPNGDEWTAKKVSGVFRGEAHRRGITNLGRKPALSEAIVTLLREMREDQGKTYAELADCLNEMGMKRPNGKAHDNNSVWAILNLGKAEQASEPAPAA